MPAVLLALIQLGTGYALVTAGGYVAVNLIMGNAVEPRFMGKGLGLSTLVVFLSLVFWGWMLGPVGMLLSVPLTMTAKLALVVPFGVAAGYWLNGRVSERAFNGIILVALGLAGVRLVYDGITGLT